jgi:hypothetical protein
VGCEAVEVGIGSKMRRVIMRCYLTTCCAEKREDEGLLPAKERYQSERVKHVVSESERSNVPLLFLSGKYRVLDANDLIPWYDKALSEEDVNDLIPVVVAQLSDRDVAEITLFAMPRNTSGWGPYYAVIEKACEELNIDIEYETVYENCE